jgi:hypothetical protein
MHQLVRDVGRVPPSSRRGAPSPRDPAIQDATLTRSSRLYHRGMVQDLAALRLDNALRLFDEFVQATVKHPDAATLRGLEGRFAERLGIQPSYWSQIKSRARQIGERLARQFEQACHKPHGWMDQPHGTAAGPASPGSGASPRTPAGAAPAPTPAASSPAMPQDEDERFIVGLVLTYYRRHPQRARARLLDLLGEVLTDPAAQGKTGTPGPATSPAAPAAPAADDGSSLWARTRAGVAPLKRKR